jgi:pimeloyl-ACP methyl ester carboxylesterase
MMTAALAPGRIRSLTLVSPANPWSKIGRKRLALLENPVVAAAFPKIARPLKSLHAYFVRRMYGDPRRIARDTIAGYRKALARRGVLEHAVQITRSWQADMQELQEALPIVADIPALLVWGSRDRVVDPASADLLSHHFNAVRTAIIHGAGHLPYEECPDEFSRLILDFLTLPSLPAVLGGK